MANSFKSNEEDPYLNNVVDMDRDSLASHSLSSRDEADSFMPQANYFASDVESEKLMDEQRAKELLAESKPKKVSRILPIFIDLIILSIEICIFAGYFYMAFIYKNLDRADCIVDINSTVPLSDATQQEGVNVTIKFRRAILWGFWMVFAMFLRTILT